MDIRYEIKKMAKSPIVLTACILFSVMILLQFIGTFTINWLQLFLFMGNVVTAVGLWLIYGTAVAKGKKVSSAGFTCLYAGSIVQIVFAGIGEFFYFMVGAAVVALGSEYDDSSYIVVMGLLIILLCTSYEVISILLHVKLMMAIKEYKNASDKGIIRKIPNLNVFIIMELVVDGILILGFFILIIGITTINNSTYYLGGAYISETTGGMLSIGSMVTSILITGVRIAYYVLVMLMTKNYEKRFKNINTSGGMYNRGFQNHGYQNNQYGANYQNGQYGQNGNIQNGAKYQNGQYNQQNQNYRNDQYR